VRARIATRDTRLRPLQRAADVGVLYHTTDWASPTRSASLGSRGSLVLPARRFTTRWPSRSPARGRGRDAGRALARAPNRRPRNRAAEARPRRARPITPRLGLG